MQQSIKVNPHHINNKQGRNLQSLYLDLVLSQSERQNALSLQIQRLTGQIQFLKARNSELEQALLTIKSSTAKLENQYSRQVQKLKSQVSKLILEKEYCMVGDAGFEEEINILKQECFSLAGGKSLLQTYVNLMKQMLLGYLEQAETVSDFRASKQETQRSQQAKANNIKIARKQSGRIQQVEMTQLSPKAGHKTKQILNSLLKTTQQVIKQYNSKQIFK